MERESNGKPVRGLFIREVQACNHVGVNMLVLANVRNFFLRQPGYIVFEDDLCKVVCPECLMKATKLTGA